MRPFRFGLSIIFSFLVFCLLHSSPVAAQSGDAGLGRLTDYLPATGRDDAWQYTNTGNGFEISNVGNPQAITYFYVGPEAGTEGRRRIDVVLEVHPDSTGSAGILYGLNEQRDLYHMITLDPQGMVRVFRRDGDGFRALVELSSAAFQQGRANRLTVCDKSYMCLQPCTPTPCEYSRASRSHRNDTFPLIYIHILQRGHCFDNLGTK